MQFLRVLSVLAVIGVIAASVYISKGGSILPKQDNAEHAVNDNPTENPFYDLTIPYLRSREYKSELGSLERLSSSGNYTSYLTSYTSDGLKINGLLTQPTGEMPEGGWPAIVFIHGYIPPTQYSTTERYDDYINYLARNGFVVFKIDLRGHGDSEGQPGGAYYSSDYIIDALNARAALQASDFVNKDKIGFWGHSMAGNVVSRALATKPEIRAAVIWAGAGYSYTDLNTYGLSDNSYRPPSTDTGRQRRRNEIREKYGEPKDGNPFWKTVAFTNYLGDLKGTIQLHHAVNDETVDVEYSRELNKLLDETSVPHEYYEYPAGGHDIEGASFSQAMQRTVDFYKKYLGN